MKELLSKYHSVEPSEVTHWFKSAPVDRFPENAGACVKYKDKQIAVFNFKRIDQWYACQNLCPHKIEMVLSRGMIGDEDDIPKVACPIHKKTFSLLDGKNLNGTETDIATYPVKIEEGYVFIGFDD